MSLESVIDSARGRVADVQKTVKTTAEGANLLLQNVEVIGRWYMGSGEAAKDAAGLRRLVVQNLTKKPH